MKPIGILTFHRASNYGAVLQAYAMQKVITEKGRKAVIVDYRCPAVEEGHRPWGLFKRHRFPVVLLRCLVAIRKDLLFGAFRKNHLKLSVPVRAEDLAKERENYSLFVAGSDQVWNNIFSGMDPSYMLTFAREEQRYSYACSFGFDKFPEGTKEVYREWITGMQGVSVRENRAADLAGEIGCDARVDLDPTLLLSREKWEEFMTPAEVTKPYIFVYTVNPPVHLLDAARELSRRTGLEVLYLNNQYKDNRDLTRLRYRTPEEYVGLIAGAEYVLTNSFHGTAFAVLFKKKLKVELETAKKFNVRSRDLLMSCGLRECVLTNSEEDYVFDADWDEADRRLGTMRARSLKYIDLIAERADQVERE